jgi:hypothetical protein
MPYPPRQLALALNHTESYAREDFLSGPCNADALALIEYWPDWPANAVVLVGPEGSGKTHLAMIWAGVAGARIISARALGEAGLPSALATGALVVEDAEMEADGRALFHLASRRRRSSSPRVRRRRPGRSSFPTSLRGCGLCRWRRCTRLTMRCCVR